MVSSQLAFWSFVPPTYMLSFRCPVHWHSSNHWSHSPIDTSLAVRKGLCWSLCQPHLLRCGPLFVFQVLHPPSLEVTSSDICKALLCLCSYFYLNNIYRELRIFPGRCLHSYSIISWIIFLELSAICQSIHCSEVAEPECNVLNGTSKRRQIFISFYAIWCFYIASISHICHPLGKTLIPVSFSITVF